MTTPYPSPSRPRSRADARFPLIIALFAGLAVLGLGGSGQAAPTPSGAFCGGSDMAEASALVTLTTANGQLAHGSGFVWDGAGRVVTNHHVAAAGWAPRITYGDGRQVAARVLAVSAVDDLAVLEPVGGDGLGRVGNHPLLIAAVVPGQRVVAYGNPGGHGLARGEGYVRALGRRVDSAGTLLPDMIETSVPLVPGNSGGPLFDCAGRFVGLNAAAVLTAQGSSAGFTIPAQQVARVVTAMLGQRDGARPVLASAASVPASLPPSPPPRLGVSVSPVADGLVVVSVTPGQPGALAGLRVGDVLRSVGRRRLAQPADVGVALTSAMAEGAPWLEVARDGRLLAMTVSLSRG